ncbi:Ultraviolet-B receptor UVR8-like protein [Drosera capensis]
MEPQAPPQSSPNLAHKIVSIAAGEAHTLALTGDGRVYSWGRGTLGRLGTGSDYSDQLFPVPVSAGEDVKFVGVAAGSYHSLALADDASVWSWENMSMPRRLDDFLERDSSRTIGNEAQAKHIIPSKISAVKAGGMMSLAIDNLGGLWIWGNCPQQSSSSDEQFSISQISNPIQVRYFHGHTVVKVACGTEHVIALVSAGEKHIGDDLICYSWGSNKCGQLGLGDTKSRSRPQIIETFNQQCAWTVHEMACGAHHTALLTVNKKLPAVRSMCWTFGLGDNGQLGLGNTLSASTPAPVRSLPEDTYFLSVDCGLFHTSIVSTVGDVWSWGMERGLGLCPDACFTGTDSGDAITPLLIPHKGAHGPRFPEPVQVACGAAHTVLVANNGYELWSWGRGWSGVLGNGKMTDSYSPTMVLWPPVSTDPKEEALPSDVAEKKAREKDPKRATEMERNLSEATEELVILRSKLYLMERYASLLHGSIFGKPLEEQDLPAALQETGTFNVPKEWERMLESADESELIRLEMFYRNLLAGVKDKLMKRRIQAIIKECLNSSNSTS